MISHMWMILLKIFQFTPKENSTEKIMLQNVGKIPIPYSDGTPKNSDEYCRGVQWPMCLNAGDISRDGKILIRNYEGKSQLF